MVIGAISTGCLLTRASHVQCYFLRRRDKIISRRRVTILPICDVHINGCVSGHERDKRQTTRRYVLDPLRCQPYPEILSDKLQQFSIRISSRFSRRIGAGVEHESHQMIPAIKGQKQYQRPEMFKKCLAGEWLLA